MSLKPRILVVDDEPEVQNLLSDLLAETGAEPCLTSSMLEAGRMMNRQKFDGVFLSGKMPSGSANRLTRNIRRSRSNASCPIVMLTTNSSPAFLEESFRAGINFFCREAHRSAPHPQSVGGHRSIVAGRTPRLPTRSSSIPGDVQERRLENQRTMP